jgi:hypothetical protein
MASDQTEQSDIARWGMIALACWTVAILGANLTAALPDDLLARLHATRLQGGNTEVLRLQVASLAREAALLRQENTSFQSRFQLMEQAGSLVRQRVGALEVSIPNLLEALPADAMIDQEAITASTGPSREVRSQDAVSVVVRHIPFEQVNPEPVPPMPPIPPAETSNWAGTGHPGASRNPQP